MNRKEFKGALKGMDKESRNAFLYIEKLIIEKNRATLTAVDHKTRDLPSVHGFTSKINANIKALGRIEKNILRRQAADDSIDMKIQRYEELIEKVKGYSDAERKRNAAYEEQMDSLLESIKKRVVEVRDMHADIMGLFLKSS